MIENIIIGLIVLISVFFAAVCIAFIFIFFASLIFPKYRCGQCDAEQVGGELCAKCEGQVNKLSLRENFLSKRKAVLGEQLFEVIEKFFTFG